MMEPRDRERLNLNYELLISRVNVDHVMLYLNRIIFNEIECDRIHAAKTSQERMKKLLDLLTTKGPHAYQHFRHALLDRYADIVKTLDGTYTQLHRSISTPNEKNAELSAIRTSLIRNLKTSRVLEYLVVEDVFDEKDCHSVRAGLTNEDKARILVDIIASRDSECYQKFKMAVILCEPKLASLFDNK
ncbi:uncharacterized protein [Antedon mediterranea]|uniref:uncharacterized protein n=1 Tax=Antedon mediterranea TaxID=105859 RepID=UPI003AF7D1C5